MSQVLELYGVSTQSLVPAVDWRHIVQQQSCPYLGRKCTKIRKSTPDVTIGTCSVIYGQTAKQIIICPNRLLDRNQIFIDCLHLLTLHEPGNELHLVSEVAIPGGSVDYFLVSARNGSVKDFVGVELQTLDTTGTVWPARQRFLLEQDVLDDRDLVDFTRSFGMNWKMTAKTALVQLNHKVKTFENVGKRLVLVIQDHLMHYMRQEFQFDHVQNVRLGDSLHFHVYTLEKAGRGKLRLELDSRFSADAAGIARSLGLQADPNVDLERIIEMLKAKISPETLFRLP